MIAVNKKRNGLRMMLPSSSPCRLLVVVVFSVCWMMPMMLPTVHSFTVMIRSQQPIQAKQQKRQAPQTSNTLLYSMKHHDHRLDRGNNNNISSNESIIHHGLLRQIPVFVALFAILLFGHEVAYADGQTNVFRFPPIDETNPNRCVVQSGSSMGQANAARDKLYDLRSCQLSNIQAAGFDLSGVIMTNTDASKANFQEAYFSKGFLRNSNFQQTDFTNAIVDRASFDGSNLRSALFTNAVLTGTSFAGADVENADFTNAALGIYDVRNLCQNPTLRGTNPVTGNDTRQSAGCAS